MSDTKELIRWARDATILARAMQEIATLADEDMCDDLGNDECLSRIEVITQRPEVREAINRNANPPRLGIRGKDQ